MSAYIVDREHIVYLVAAALDRRYSHGSFSWYHDDAPQIQDRHKTLGAGEYEKAAEVATMLWLENIKSVSHRYPGESSATLPGPVGEDFVIQASDFRVFHSPINAVQLLKSIHCYDYQTCEHPEYRKSEAYAFIRSLEKAAMRALPGYDDAEWGAPKEWRAAA